MKHFQLALALAIPLSSAALGLAQEPAAKGPTTTHSSTLWKDAKYDVEGMWSIVSTPAAKGTSAKVELVLGSDFKTKKGPDLKVVLTKLSAEKVKAKNALNDSLVLGVLKRYSGETRFVVPAGTDLKQYRAVAIHCEEYTVLWGASDLVQGHVIHQGSDWTKKAKKIRGHWEITKVGKDHFLRLGRDFDTKKGPDLKVVLSPKKLSSLNGDNALEGSLVLGKLKDDEGAQSYQLKTGIDYSKYASLLIHCEEYSKLWGGAPLKS